jgi:hypothetical protein
MDEVRVRLTWAEVLVAAQVGCMRNVQSLRGNWRPVGGCGLDDSWTANIEGACGEMVVAKHLGFYWTGALGDPTADDAGPYQVRTNASRRLDDMALRDRDKPKLDKVFISVLSFLPEFVICGWLPRGVEAQRFTRPRSAVLGAAICAASARYAPVAG